MEVGDCRVFSGSHWTNQAAVSSDSPCGEQRLKWPWGAEIRKQEVNQKERLIGHVSSAGEARVGQQREERERQKKWENESKGSQSAR